MPLWKLAKVIKALREKRGMTQAELAKKANVSQGYIAKLEPPALGRSKTVRHANPSIAVLQRLAKALGVPVTELLG
jgi:transcriptional regulator with XRE-family HTH domain